VLKRAEALRGPNGDDEPLIVLAFVYASRGERDKIDPAFCATNLGDRGRRSGGMGRLDVRALGR